MKHIKGLWKQSTQALSLDRLRSSGKGAGAKPKKPKYPSEYDSKGIHRVYSHGDKLDPEESQGIALRTVNAYLNDPHEGISPEATSPEVVGMRDTLATVPDHAIRLRLAKLYKQQRDDHNVNVLKATQKKKEGLETMAYLEKHPYGNMLEGHSITARIWDGFRRYWRALIVGAPRSASQRFYMNHKSLIIENPGFARDEVVIPIEQIGSNYAIGPDAPVWMTNINRLLVRFGGKQRYPFGLGVMNVTETGSKTDVGSIEINDPQKVIKEINRLASLIMAAKSELPSAKPPITMSDLLVDPYALIPVTPDKHPRHRIDEESTGAGTHLPDTLIREHVEQILSSISQMISESAALQARENGLNNDTQAGTDLVREHMEQIISKIPEMISESVSLSVARTLQAIGVVPKIEDAKDITGIVDADDDDYSWTDADGEDSPAPE